MKKILALGFVFAACFNLFIVKSLYADETLKKIWPPRTGSWYYYTPKRLATTEEAVANIRNLQNRMMLNGGMMPSELDVDRYGIRAKAKWVVTEKGENVASTSGGFWLGWNYIPTNTTTSQPWTKETPQEKMMIISFKDITGTAMLNGYVVGMGFSDGEAHGIIMKDKNAAKDMIDAIFTLREALSGIRTDYPKRLGLELTDMTQEQKEILSITYGVLVTGIGVDGAAELAGIKYPDIIVEVNGEKVESSADCTAKVLKSVPEVKLKILRWADEKYLAFNDYVSGTFTADNGIQYSFPGSTIVKFRAIKPNEENIQTTIITAIKK
ncbi:MAG: PDZ domain-containing protein [Elusimicrobia bacterium]|nr:PDZ domain-containing protein [Elusimicrobiota bacterium]